MGIEICQVLTCQIAGIKLKILSKSPKNAKACRIIHYPETIIPWISKMSSQFFFQEEGDLCS